MDPVIVQVAIGLMLVAVLVSAYELKESLKSPVCMECPHCLARLEEERIERAAIQRRNARLFQRDHDEDRRP